MQRVSIRALANLLAAAEAVGDHQPVGRRFADGGEEFEFPDGGGDVIFVGLKAERPGHPAAAGSWCLEIEAHPAEDRLLGVHF